MKRLLPLAFVVLFPVPAHAQASANVTVGPASDPNSFAPATVTVSAGGTVHWTWATDDHNILFEDNGYDTRLQDTGYKYSRQFTTAGTVGYSCTVHAGMVGEVRVVAASASPKPTTASPRPTTASPTPTRSATPTPSRTRTPTPKPTTPTPSPSPTSASPSPTSASPTPSTVSLEAPLPPDRTGVAIAAGLLIGVTGVGTAATMVLRGRRA